MSRKSSIFSWRRLSYKQVVIFYNKVSNNHICLPFKTTFPSLLVFLIPTSAKFPLVPTFYFLFLFELKPWDQVCQHPFTLGSFPPLLSTLPLCLECFLSSPSWSLSSLCSILMIFFPPFYSHTLCLLLLEERKWVEGDSLIAPAYVQGL